MKTNPIFLKKCNTTIQFEEIGSESYLLEENHNTNKIRVIKQEPLDLNLLKMKRRKQNE